MRNKLVRAGGRSIGLLLLAVITAGALGSVVSYYMSGAFPAGPVRDFFFKALDIGVPAFTINLGFAKFTFGIALSVTTFAVILVGLSVYFWYKL